MFLHLGFLINQTLKPPKNKLSLRKEDAIKDKEVQSFWLSFIIIIIIHFLIEKETEWNVIFTLIMKNENNCVFYFHLGHLVGSLKYN